MIIRKIRFVGSQKISPLPSLDERPHPWRVCPKGYHCTGLISRVKLIENWPIKHIFTCKANTSPKEVLFPLEMEYIAKDEFDDLKGPPRHLDLGFTEWGNVFDQNIRGWTRFWNDVLTPDVVLDPNLVKALIASESGFDENPPRNLVAKGLMQLTEQTRLALGNPKGEFKNHLVIISRKENLEANNSIAGGVRWLFRKKEIATAKLKRPATWEEAVAEYKSYPFESITNHKSKGMNRFLEYYERLKK